MRRPSAIRPVVHTVSRVKEPALRDSGASTVVLGKGNLLNPTDTPYTREELFTIPWIERATGRGQTYWVYHLARVDLEYRVYSDRHRFVTRVRWKENDPWVLGVHASLEEAKYYVYWGILYFQLHVTGDWSPQTTKKRQTYLQELQRY